MLTFMPYCAASITSVKADMFQGRELGATNECAKSTTKAVNQKKLFPTKIYHSEGDEVASAEDNEYKKEMGVVNIVKLIKKMGMVKTDTD
jgi:hypothetical protein